MEGNFTVFIYLNLVHVSAVVYHYKSLHIVVVCVWEINIPTKQKILSKLRTASANGKDCSVFEAVVRYYICHCRKCMYASNLK